MGKRGPAKQPTALKIARGNPGKQKLNDQEPEFEAPPSLDPPKDLKGAGLGEWHAQLPRLTASGVLTAADMAGFTAYCRFVGLEESYAIRLMEATDNDRIDRLVNQMVKVTNAMRSWAGHFGITPSSRSGVKAKPRNPADERRKKFGLIGGGPA
jgi:phage terminase small subunit